MTPADVFNNVLIHENLGCRFTTDQLSPGEKALFDFRRQEANKIALAACRTVERFPPVYVDFVDSPVVNAYAFEAENACFIGVTYGAVRSFTAVVRHVLAVPTVLTWIGDQHLEVVPSSRPNSLLPDIRPISAEWYAQPRCGVRRDYAEHIVNLIFTFLVSHELAHLVQAIAHTA
jgi:hypothetical protein